MIGTSASVATGTVDRVVPCAQDFYALMNEQCDVLVQAMDAFIEYMMAAKRRRTSCTTSSQRSPEIAFHSTYNLDYGGDPILKKRTVLYGDTT